MMQFIKELKEARMILNQKDMRMSYTDACENLYLCILTLEFLSRIKQTQDLAKRYADSTTNYYNYSEFRANGTDMANLIYFVNTDPKNVAKIFNSEDAGKLRESTHLPLMALNGYLTSMNNPNNRDIYFLMRIETALRVTHGGSKEIRRLLSYRNPQQSDVNLTANRILNEFRTKMPTYDLMSDLESKLQGNLTYIHEKN